MQEAIEPVRRTLVVRHAPERAFELFTRRMGEWWPLATHSVGQEKAVRVVVEERAGGRVYEEHADGGSADWGVVQVWDPPRRFAMTWRPGYEEPVHTDLSITFTPEEGGTRLELVHAGWERLGERGPEMRSGYDGGWAGVLAELEKLAAAEAPAPGP